MPLILRATTPLKRIQVQCFKFSGMSDKKVGWPEEGRDFMAEQLDHDIRNTGPSLGRNDHGQVVTFLRKNPPSAASKSMAYSLRHLSSPLPTQCTTRFRS
mmetsp:Transcript_24423/g.44281  ORF Transcript_24423/g.44281 Transcript_24423/m.44281 type:complete len:100 (+) Transcript_24423:1839-2138(+)